MLQDTIFGIFVKEELTPEENGVSLVYLLIKNILVTGMAKILF